eukprot:CAMPEP_0180075102 /NCGR_PEP_ID=MMETSP0985-20121206/14306_1 /TAXON_ID=483367 /ORGANISM="non described non described, Strain CCMP 2436" /LENGTH=235 /DNA_ID=CAMNT_0022006989 /DNA_START=12 /DNA_END=719 /DNA_ORIENTATION=+
MMHRSVRARSIAVSWGAASPPRRPAATALFWPQMGCCANGARRGRTRRAGESAKVSATALACARVPRRARQAAAGRFGRRVCAPHTRQAAPGTLRPRQRARDAWVSWAADEPASQQQALAGSRATKTRTRARARPRGASPGAWLGGADCGALEARHLSARAGPGGRQRRRAAPPADGRPIPTGELSRVINATIATTQRARASEHSLARRAPHHSAGCTLGEPACLFRALCKLPRE